MLEGISQRSHASYPDGGLIYTYTEAANQAHCKFPKTLSKYLAPHLSEDDRAQLALVLCKTLGNLDYAVADAESLALTDDLMQRLQADLELTRVSIVAEEKDDYCWGATIHMARRSDNRYFSLGLWGSID